MYWIQYKSAKAGLWCTLLMEYGNTGDWMWLEGFLVMDPATEEILMTAALLQTCVPTVSRWLWPLFVNMVGTPAQKEREELHIYELIIWLIFSEGSIKNYFWLLASSLLHIVAYSGNSFVLVGLLNYPLFIPSGT